MIHIMNNEKLQKIETKLRKIKKQLFEIGEMRPGSLTKQYRKSKVKYGEYWQLSYTFKGKGRTEYIRNPFVTEVKKQVAAYARFRQLIDQWISHSIEHAQLKMERARASAEQQAAKT